MEQSTVSCSFGIQFVRLTACGSAASGARATLRKAGTAVRRSSVCSGVLCGLGHPGPLLDYWNSHLIRDVSDTFGDLMFARMTSSKTAIRLSASIPWESDRRCSEKNHAPSHQIARALPEIGNTGLKERSTICPFIAKTYATVFNHCRTSSQPPIQDAFKQMNDRNDSE